MSVSRAAAEPWTRLLASMRGPTTACSGWRFAPPLMLTVRAQVTPIYRPETAIELAIAVSLLQAHDVPYCVHNRGFASLYPGIQLHLLNARTILVPSEASEMAKDILAQFLEDTSGLRQSREHSPWHTVRLVFEAICTGWCVPRVGYAEGKRLEP